MKAFILLFVYPESPEHRMLLWSKLQSKKGLVWLMATITVLNYTKKAKRNSSIFLTTYCLSKKVMASQKITHFCAWKRQIRNIVKMVALVFMPLRQRPLNAGVEWKRSVITVHTNPSRKQSYHARSLSKTIASRYYCDFPHRVFFSNTNPKYPVIVSFFKYRGHSVDSSWTEPYCQTHKNPIKCELKGPWWP